MSILAPSKYTWFLQFSSLKYWGHGTSLLSTPQPNGPAYILQENEWDGENQKMLLFEIIWLYQQIWLHLYLLLIIAPIYEFPVIESVLRRFLRNR